MYQLFFTIMVFSVLMHCKNSISSTDVKTDHLGLVVESELKNDQIIQGNCVFLDPDTSVAGIRLRNIESVLNILGNQTLLDSDSKHTLSSSDGKQILSLTIYPGETSNQVSVFHISYLTAPNGSFRQVPHKEFITEKGIKLGISKTEILNKLGTCYTTKDSTANSMILEYNLQVPNDSKTGILTRNKMPVYYANYKLTNNLLENFEFGFENP